MAAQRFKTVEEYVESVIRLEKSGHITADECSEALLRAARGMNLLPGGGRVGQIRTTATYGLYEARRRRAKIDARECEVTPCLSLKQQNPERSVAVSQAIAAVLGILSDRDRAAVESWLRGDVKLPADRVRVSRALAKIRSRFQFSDLA